MRRFIQLITTLVLLGPLAATSARADVLREAFLNMSLDSRRAVQGELARADLFLAPTDGQWSSWTDRALRRGADMVTQVTLGDVHPNLYRRDGVQLYLAALESGKLARLLHQQEPEQKETDNGLFGFLKGY